MYDSKGNLTYEGARGEILKGGSILHKGKQYVTLESLPPRSEFAQGDPKELQAAQDDIIRRRHALDAEQEILDKATGGTPSPEKPNPATDVIPPVDETDELDKPEMTKTILLGIARDEGLDLPETMNKADIKTAIREKREENPAD